MLAHNPGQVTLYFIGLSKSCSATPTRAENRTLIFSVSNEGRRTGLSVISTSGDSYE